MEVRQPGEQEAAVTAGGTSGDPSGVDADHVHPSVQQLADRSQTGAAEADHRHLGLHVVLERRKAHPRRRDLLPDRSRHRD